MYSWMSFFWFCFGRVEEEELVVYPGVSLSFIGPLGGGLWGGQAARATASFRRVASGGTGMILDGRWGGIEHGMSGVSHTQREERLREVGRLVNVSSASSSYKATAREKDFFLFFESFFVTFTSLDCPTFSHIG